MKKKKIKKIAGLIAKHLEDYRSRPVKESIEEFEWSGYDEEVSKKFKIMVFNIIKYRENLNLRIHDDQISITSEDIVAIKGKKRLNAVYSEENFLRIDICKKGFHINKGYLKRSSFLDDKIFDEILPFVIESQKTHNSENFTSVWNDIMKDSGIARDNNLDQLFNG